MEICSLEAASQLNKRHADVLRDIRNIYNNGNFCTDDLVKVEWKSLKANNRPTFKYLLYGDLADAYKTKYLDGQRVNLGKIKEKTSLSTIEQVLNINLIREYSITTNDGQVYRIDGYDEVNNVAYEIDEPHHYFRGRLTLACKVRQDAIEKVLNCTFKRIKV